MNIDKKIEEKSYIFISLVGRAVFRNLFYFPRSAFSLLKEEARRRNFHIVVLVPEKDKGKYDSLLGDGLGSIYNILEVPVPSPKETFLQKAFFFFYSHLIYTDTTRLMATLGMRPDEPPAGGKRYLAPLKKIIARTFGSSRIFKRFAVPWLFRKVYRELPFADVFEKYKPSLVVISHMYGWFDQNLLAEAKLRGVRNVGLPAGWDHLDKYFFPFSTDRLIAQSKELKRGSILYQAYNPEEVVVTGYPHFDFIIDSSYKLKRSEVLKRLGFPSDAKFILYVSGSTYCPDEPDIIETLLTWIENGELGKNVFLVIRPYLGGRSKDREFDEKKYNQFENHPLVSYYRDDFWEKYETGIVFMNILNQADIVLAIFTTMALEASILDRPLLAVGFDGHNVRPLYRSVRRYELFEHFQHVRATGALPTAYNFKELKKMLKDNLENPALFAKEREKMRLELAAPLDGKASERVVREIISQLSWR